MARATFKLPNIQVPKQGPMGMPFTVALAANVAQEFDLFPEQSDGSFDFVQSMYVLNRSGGLVTFDFLGANYRLPIDDKQVGLYPVVVPEGLTRFRVTGAAEGTVYFTLFNVLMPFFTFDLA